VLALVALSLPLTLTACDSADDDSASGDIAALVGMWAFDDDDEDGYYVEFTRDARVKGWVRYQGPHGCFGRDGEEESRIEALGNNRYAITWTNSDGTVERSEATITVSGNRMTVVGQDGGETYTSTLTRWTATPNVCAFTLGGSYLLTRVNGSALPYSYSATGSTGQTHTFRVDQGYAWISSGSGIGLSVDQRLPNGGFVYSGWREVYGTTAITSAAGAFEITPSSQLPAGISATGSPTGDNVRVMLRHPEMGPNPLELTFVRDTSNRDAPAASGRLFGRPTAAAPAP